VRTYIERVLWRHVLLGLDGCRYIIHTDSWSAINDAPAMRRLKRFCEVEYRALPPELGTHERMSACHLDAMKDAEAILFLMPDNVVNVEAFDFVKNCGKKLVVVGSLRTLSDSSEELPLHASDLAEWSVKHLHPNWHGLVWGSSREASAQLPTNLYFRGATGFWMHGFHLHPLAAVLTEKNRAPVGTVDGDFVGSYAPDDVYVVANLEISQCEITARARGAGENSWDISHPSNVVAVMRSRANAMHMHFFRHRIMLAGTYDRHCEGIPNAILDRMMHG
jgi:hypothetical protein